MPAPYDPVPVLNVSGEDIPSHAVVEPTGVITDGAFEVTKPTRSGNRAVLVNGPGTIPDGKAGQAYGHPRVVVASDDEPERAGEEWGAEAGSWELSAGTPGGFVYLGGYAAGRGNWLRVGDGTGNGTTSALSSSTLLPCPVIDNGCCILFPECGTVYDCKGRPIERIAVDFATICEDGIEGVSTTVPSNCGDRTSHCGNTESACLPRCDYPATDDVLTDAGDAGDCCTPSVGSVMESSPHAGECGFFPPCVTIAGGNGTGTLAGITFDTAANVNYDAEWPFAYTAPGGNFYITGRLVLCLESPFPGWYFAGRVYVYNPAGNSGSGDTDECGCDTVFGACPTAADDASQEIVAFHLGDKTETLRLTTACGTLDLAIAPCDTPDVPDPVEYACVAGPTGNICTPTVGGPYLNDPTCGGKCDEKDPDPPDPGPDDLCEGGEPAGGYPNLLVTIPDGPDAGAYVVGYTGGSTGTFVTFAISSPPYPPVATNISVTFNTTYAGAWGIIEGAGFTTAQAIAVSCTPFGLVFPGAIFGSSGDVTVVIA